MDFIAGQCLVSDEKSAFWTSVRHSTQPLPIIRHCRRAVGQNMDFIVGQCLVSDEKSACWTPVRHSTLSDGSVKVCLSSGSK